MLRRSTLALMAASLTVAAGCSTEVRDFNNTSGGVGGSGGGGQGGSVVTATGVGGAGGVGQGGQGTGGSGGQGGAPGVGIYVNTWQALYKFDAAANTLDMVGKFDCIGATKTASVTDIAVDKAGNMFGAGSDAGYPYQLLKIDRNNASCAVIGPVGDGLYPSSLALLPVGLPDPASDTLVGLVEKAGGGYSTFYAIFDRNTGVATLNQNLKPFISGTFADLVMASDTSQLYGVSQPGTEAEGDPDHLVELDPKSGMVLKDLGSMGIDGFGGLAYGSGNLYGFTSSGHVYLIDRATAAAAEIKLTNQPSGGLIFAGAATVP